MESNYKGIKYFLNSKIAPVFCQGKAHKNEDVSKLTPGTRIVLALEKLNKICIKIKQNKFLF